MTDENNPCSRIFKELVDKKCIVTSAILEESNRCRYFKVIPLNKILYHPNMKSINEDSIEFCLLHEENHNRHPFKTPLLFLAIEGFFFVLWYIIRYPFELLVLFFFIGVVFLVFLLRIEEYRCDEFAIFTMKNELHIEEQPSEIIKRTLDIITYDWLSKITHPPHKDRIKNIAERFDEKKKIHYNSE